MHSMRQPQHCCTCEYSIEQPCQVRVRIHPGHTKQIQQAAYKDGLTNNSWGMGARDEQVVRAGGEVEQRQLGIGHVLEQAQHARRRQVVECPLGAPRHLYAAAAARSQGTNKLAAQLLLHVHRVQRGGCVACGCTACRCSMSCMRLLYVGPLQSVQTDKCVMQGQLSEL
jgi:hypothetical protein